MTLEVELPLEFVVFGVPISPQASSSSREAWKKRVAAAVLQKLPEGHWATLEQLSVAIVYFSSGPSTIDTDNMIKPILDALTHVVWLDDRQVCEVTARKTDRSLLANLTNPPADLAAALETNLPFVYVRVRTMIGHEELPR